MRQSVGQLDTTSCILNTLDMRWWIANEAYSTELAMTISNPTSRVN